jgi:hypothetical protein
MVKAPWSVKPVRRAAVIGAKSAARCPFDDLGVVEPADPAGRPSGPEPPKSAALRHGASLSEIDGGSWRERVSGPG